MTPLIIMVGADKGGVGKTTVSRALVDYFTAQGQPFRSFDTEYPKGALQRFVPNATVIDIERVQDQMRVFDEITGVTIIDVRAGMLSSLLRLLDRAHLLDDVKSGAINLALLHLLGPTLQSLGEIPEAAESLGATARHLLVKNYISRSTGFFDWDADNRLADLFERMRDKTIIIEHLENIACEMVDKLGVSYGDFMRDAKHSRMLRGLVKSWLEATWKEFDRVGLSGLASAALA